MSRAINFPRTEVVLAMVAMPVCIMSIGFLTSGSVTITLAATIVIGLVTWLVYKSLNLMSTVEDGLELRTLDALDSDWRERQTMLEWILVEACYRWQVSEFGAEMATQEFRFLPDHPNANTAFGLFQPMVDIDDLGRSLPPEKMARAWRARQIELEQIAHPGEAALERLNDIMVTIASEVAPIELVQALMDCNRLTIDSSEHDPMSYSQVQTGSQLAKKTRAAQEAKVKAKAPRKAKPTARASQPAQHALPRQEAYRAMHGAPEFVEEQEVWLPAPAMEARPRYRIAA
ncbi:hypothetical protein ACEUZ9_002865 [Paracoccus litorisediminis]|uniref:hypothetical protein n=1 Tax=Paracoccus litorisediminis TaxID=2006130 RepID=UPI00373140D1